MRLIIFALMSAFAITAFAGPVRIVTRDRALIGRPVTVLRKSDSQFEVIESKAEISPSGVCDLSLEPGDYRFEVFDKSGFLIFCVRSPETSVGQTPVTVPMNSVEMRLRAEKDGVPLKLSRLAVRSLGRTGEVNCDLPNLRVAKLRTSETTNLTVMFAGHEQTEAAVGWVRIQTAPDVTVRPTSSWMNRTFRLHPENPPLEFGACKLQCPRNEFQLPIGDGIRLATNIPTMRMKYAMLSRQGTALVSRTALVDFNATEDVLLGGPLEPKAYAKVMKKLPKAKHLVAGTVLTDASGREIDLEESKIGWKTAVFLRGRPGLPSNPLDESELGVIANPLDTVEFHAMWRWKHDKNLIVRPEPFQRFSSRKFAFNAPAGWSGRANIYLAILESSSVAMRTATSRKGPRKTWVMWRLNTHNAKAQVGGRNPWMSMPFKGLRGAKSPEGTPWFLLHEMAHTFGYNHGKKMNAAIGASRRQRGFNRWEVPADEIVTPIQISEPQIASATAGDIEILKAVFGRNSAWIDVTDSVEAALRSDPSIVHNSAIGHGIADPASGKTKHLKITYRVNGQTKSISLTGGRDKQIDLRKVL